MQMANLKYGELLSHTSYIVYYGLKDIHNATWHDNHVHDIARSIIYSSHIGAYMETHIPCCLYKYNSGWY